MQTYLPNIFINLWRHNMAHQIHFMAHITTIMKIKTNALYAFLLLLIPQFAFAIDSQELPDVKPGIVSMKIVEPERLVGYTVGDVIARDITLTIKAPYKLIDTSLPIVGYEKRYRGQVIGIELKSITHTKKEQKDSVKHDINMAYQVFTNNVVAKNAVLGPEYVQLINVNDKKDLVKFRIPSVGIAVSPIAIFGAVKVETNMTQFREPLLLDKSRHSAGFKYALAILAASLLGLVYILGQRAWLPRMGGAFAKAYRKLNRFSRTHAPLKDSVAAIHQAFNDTAGYSVFSSNLNTFLAEHPQFNAVQSEINTFFAISRQVYFEPQANMPVAEPQGWLIKFARHCRDCERGLLPDNFAQTSPSASTASV